MQARTLPQAIEDAAKAAPSRGFRFIPETGVPGFSGPGRSEPPPGPAAGGAPAIDPNQTSYSFTAVERFSARLGGALQALGLRNRDRVALILPNNDDFVLCFLRAILPAIFPAPIYP